MIYPNATNMAAAPSTKAPTLTPTLIPELGGGVAPGAALPVAVGPRLATALNPPVTAPLSVSVASEEPIFTAAAWKAEKVLVPLVGALMLPTMPMPQCSTCLQWNQIGLVSSVIIMVNCFELVSPESNPAVLFADAARYVHGAWKELWVTEWSTPVFGNQKVTEVPFGAVISLGPNVKVEFSATLTLM